MQREQQWNHMQSLKELARYTSPTHLDLPKTKQLLKKDNKKTKKQSLKILLYTG